jgi:ectoine hydroxylase-related dioxygenase (phytanoyl-CoA dioxygenase family)
VTPEQRYLFDVSGYLHIKNALSDEELANAQAAADRYATVPLEELPPGFEPDRKQGGYPHGFAFDKALESLVFHPSLWPIVKELTGNKPRFASGSMRINSHGNRTFGRLHCAREDWGPQTPRYHVTKGQMYCDFFVCFFYLTDVFPGDGGLVVIPGSHKAEYPRPDDFFAPESDEMEPEPHPAVLNITPGAGDVIIITELLTHGVLIWKPEDRDRRFLLYRYVPQYIGSTDEHLPFPFPDEVLARLSPETRELTEMAPFTYTKEVVKRDVVTLS